jgi:hypothetical protein
MSMKNSNDIMGNRFRDFPVCSAVPQPLRHRVPLFNDVLYQLYIYVNYLRVYLFFSGKFLCTSDKVNNSKLPHFVSLCGSGFLSFGLNDVRSQSFYQDPHSVSASLSFKLNS